MTDKDMPQTGLLYNGTEIRALGERLNLTDMWRAAGADPSRKPAEWLRSADAERFVTFLADALNMGNPHLFQIAKGRTGSTTAHWQIGLAYAKYLSPDFHMWCNTVVRERMEPMHHDSAWLPEEVRRTDGISRMLAHKVTGIEKEVGQIGAAVIEVAGEVVSQGKMLKLMMAAMEEQDRRINGLLIANDPRVAAVERISPLEIAIKHDIPPKGRQNFCVAAGNQMARISANWEVAVSLSHETKKRLFTMEVANYWLHHAGGLAFIAAWKSKAAGQGAFKLVPMKPKKPTDSREARP